MTTETTETTTTGVDIDAIRKLTDAATAGPWAHDGNDGLVWPQRIGDPVSGSNEMEDADFIAAARTLVPALCDEIEKLRAELDRARADERNTIAADIENMPINLGDTGWKHLETKADEASYPPEWVRRRRSRDDFTTATIEVAYQYGYRQAAKVARGEVAR